MPNSIARADILTFVHLLWRSCDIGSWKGINELTASIETYEDEWGETTLGSGDVGDGDLFDVFHFAICPKGSDHRDLRRRLRRAAQDDQSLGRAARRETV